MRLLPIRQCVPGMKLGKAVYSPEGNTLLRADAELTLSLIKRLERFGFDFLYIVDAQTEDIAILEPISEETRRTAYAAVYNAFRKFGEDFGPGSFSEYSAATRTVIKAMQLIHDELAANKPDMIVPMNINVMRPSEWESHYCSNAINTSVYATVIGSLQHYREDEKLAFGIAALLHDVGNSRISPAILRKTEPLTQHDIQEIRKHTELGFDLLKNDLFIPEHSLQCILQHHERIDGSGYPNRLVGEQILDDARWLGLVDSYDAMTNPRAYRPAMLPHQALEVLYTGSGTLYDKRKVELFRDHTAIYPTGINVTLSTGERGVVSRINPTIKQRPVIRILQNEAKETLKAPYEIDLSRNLSIMIDSIAGDSPKMTVS